MLVTLLMSNMLLVLLMAFTSSKPGEKRLIETAQEFLQWYDETASKEYNLEVQADWNYQIDVTDENSQQLVNAQLRFGKFNKEAWNSTLNINWEALEDPDLKRQFKKISNVGIAILDDVDLEQYNQAISDMQGIYAKTKICSYDEPTKCDLNLDPELTEIMAQSRDYEELQYVWKEWHEKAGRPMRELFTKYVKLGNKASVMDGYNNRGEVWRIPYESSTFVDDIADLWNQLKPFYQQLHAYVRRKLRFYYGHDKINPKGPIPAHLLGNMWSQTWSNIYDLTIPFLGKPSVDVTDEMIAQGYDVLQMFHTSDEFFKSLGLIPLTDTFWKNSLLERPENREVVCHASAWDFYDQKDFRIKMCTKINMEDLITIHHEMGHIQYFMQYKDQPVVYRDGANPGFHEAVGDTLALAVATPKHLHKIGLLSKAENDYETDINYLMMMALDKVAFLPFGYGIDLWRWQVFEGEVTEQNYNEKWWQIRKDLQGIVPPVTRSEEDFDPGAKYHVAADVPYIRYFVSFVVQFQFYKSLCLEAGEYVPGDESKPLYKCDFYQNKDAGKLLSDMLSLGSSKQWPEAMKIITKGVTDKMDASAIMEYFKPLIAFLESENEKYGEYIGWE